MNTNRIETLQSLQRGEISATEIYQQALEKFEGTACAAELATIQIDHRTAANTLREHIRGHGGKPEKGSGAWGTFAKVVEGTAKAFGESAALQALKEGEEQGVKDYETAANDNSLSSDCRALIETELLPRTKAHVSKLDRMIANLKA